MSRVELSGGKKYHSVGYCAVTVKQFDKVMGIAHEMLSKIIGVELQYCEKLKLSSFLRFISKEAMGL